MHNAARHIWQLEFPPTARAAPDLRMLVHRASGPSRVLLDHGAAHAQLLLMIPGLEPRQRFSLPWQWRGCVHVCACPCAVVCACVCVYVCMRVNEYVRVRPCVWVQRLSHVWQSRSPPFVQPTWSTHVITRPLEVVKMCWTGSPEAASIEAPTTAACMLVCTRRACSEGRNRANISRDLR